MDHRRVGAAVGRGLGEVVDPGSHAISHTSMRRSRRVRGPGAGPRQPWTFFDTIRHVIARDSPPRRRYRSKPDPGKPLTNLLVQALRPHMLSRFRGARGGHRSMQETRARIDPGGTGLPTTCLPAPPLSRLRAVLRSCRPSSGLRRARRDPRCSSDR